MKQVNENLQNHASAGEYLAPMVKVHEIKTRTVLCASDSTEDVNKNGGSLDQYFG